MPFTQPQGSTRRPSALAENRLRAAFAAEERNDIEEATRLYTKITTQHPEFAAGWHYYGLLLQRQGESDQALDTLYRAHQIEPENPIFLLNVALTLWAVGDIAHAIGCLWKAHELNPDHAQIFMQLAKALVATEQGDALIAEVERHLGMANGEWRLWNVLGKCREQGGDRAGAMAAYAEAVRLAPISEVEPLVRRALCAQKMGLEEKAREDFETILKVAPESGKAFSGLANLASEHGDFETSERLARKALEKDPHLYAAWASLAAAHPLTPNEQLARQLEEATEHAGGEPKAFALYFALGKVWENLGDYDKAFSAYRKGNDLKKIIRPYLPERQVTYIRNLTLNLNENFLERAPHIGIRGTDTIFVCGMPRSGTTLVETILASHPEVTPGGELRYIHDHFRRTLGVAGMFELGTWLSRASDAALADIARGWAHSLRDTAAGLPRVTDKMPGNYALLGLIHLCLPDAHIVHVSRDPRDNCFSCYATSFAEGHAFSYTLDSLGHYYRLYEHLVAHWRRMLGQERIIEVRYESLVQDPEGETRRLLDAVNLDWDPRCLNFHKTPRKVRTASSYQVRQPLYTTSIGRWKRFERHMDPLLDALAAPSPIV
jgi:tetratricopeptide (TPR) repeat protein